MSQITANYFGKMSQISSPVCLSPIFIADFPSVGDKLLRRLAGFTQKTQESMQFLRIFGMKNVNLLPFFGMKNVRNDDNLKYSYNLSSKNYNFGYNTINYNAHILAKMLHLQQKC